MSALVLECRLPGMLTTVQDGGRWGYQGKGMPVAGAMDLQSFRLGNILVGNDENDAALEVTVLGPTLYVSDGEGMAAVTGADLGFQVNGQLAPMWTALAVKAGDTLSFSGPKSGCRAYLCFSGGIEVPVVMESRSTYTRAKVGGLEGRALKKDDRVLCGEPKPLWKKCEGLVCPRGTEGCLSLRCPSPGGRRSPGKTSLRQREYRHSTDPTTLSPTVQTVWDTGWTVPRSSIPPRRISFPTPYLWARSRCPATVSPSSCLPTGEPREDTPRSALSAQWISPLFPSACRGTASGL